MARNERSLETSSPARDSDPAEISAVGTPSVVSVPERDEFDLYKFRESKVGKDLVQWALNEFSRCKGMKNQKQTQWYINMAFNFGHQWLDVMNKGLAAGLAQKLRPKVLPAYIERRTVNRIRSFVRTEQSKFLSTLPSITAVPATAEEEDIRAAYAAEQVLESYTSKRNLRREYSKAIYWMILTGTGIVKTWWDPTTIDKTSEQPGDIVYKSVSPFHIFVPDMREHEIDDQAYIIQAQVKPLEWCRQFYGEELMKQKITPSQISANGLLDDAYFNLSNTPKSELDSVVILEVWVKPGTHKDLPHGGLLILVEDCLVGAFIDGMPYKHGQYPYTKIEHLSNDTFFADSPLVDLIPLQKEFNDLRTQIGIAGKRMGNPQLLAQQGSIVPGRMTNEPGMIVQYRPGTPPPQPMPLQPIPDYVLAQLPQIMQDFEDLSGQHEVSKGHNPTSVSSGTALAFLKETDDSYLTPQYQNIEDAFERMAVQTIELFKEFVDTKRKIKVIGLDSAYDTALLSGSDVAGGSDIRVEPGSSIGQSQAAKRAAVMDMFAVGILTDPNQALRLLEVGGAQKVLDTVSVAEKKAQRENMKMKALGTSAEGMSQLQQYLQDEAMQIIGPMVQELQGQQAADIDPMTGEPVLGDVITPESIMQNPEIMQEIMQMIPPMVKVDDFDMHAIHIDTHNRYRMGQEYETLPDPVKAEFDKHVSWHERMLAEQYFQQQSLQETGMMPGEEGGQPVEQPVDQADSMAPNPAQPVQ